MKINYDFAKEFTENPGPRYRTSGDKSGEEFREDVLKPLLKEYDFINIDYTNIKTWFSPSFLSEICKLDKPLSQKIKFYSIKNPKLEERFKLYAGGK